MLQKILALTLSAAVITALCACGKRGADETPETQAAPAVTDNFTTTVLKSGKSDAIVLESANATVVIDCGEESDGDKVVEYLQSKGKTSVEYLIITHFDQDHVGGAAEVIENIDIGEIIAPDYEGSNSEYTNFITAAANAKKEITRLTESRIFTMEDVLYEVYPPLKNSYKEEDNDYSIVVKATHGDDTLLFAGDAETARLKELYSQLDVSADFLKVPHHGRIDEESETFINAVSPKYAAVTCSKKEGAEDELLEILENAGTQIFLSRDGTITAVSTGSGINVSQETETQE